MWGHGATTQGGEPLHLIYRFRWPSGVVQRLEGIEANQALTVREPEP